MKIIDRYIVRQIAGPFLFFLLVFGGILWLNQALKVVDIVIENGQPGSVFVEISLYLLPRVLESVLPVAAFAAALFLTNRLYAESEYVVLLAAGQTPLQFAQPFLIFGIISFAIVSALIHFVTPISNNALQNRQHEIRQEYLSQLIKTGEFISPKKGVTFYFGNLRDDGQLEDIIIRETTDQDKQIIHSAPTGRIVDNDGDAKLVLINGILQQFEQDTHLLTVVQFDSFSYDLSQFAKNIGARNIGADETVTTKLPFFVASADDEEKPKAIEAQSRLAKSLFSLLMPLLGAAILFSGSFSRAGFYYRIIFAVAVLLGLNTLRGTAESLAVKSPTLSAVLYTPALLSIIIIVLLLLITIKGWDSHTLKMLLRRKQVAP